MRRQTGIAVAAAGLILSGGGIAAATSTHRPVAGAAHSATALHPGYGRVAGAFEREGGPLGPGGKQPPVVPLSGSILFARPGHRTVRVRAGSKGRFSVRLAPGDYAVSGRTAGLPVCRLPRVKVTASRTKHIVVACVVP
jgi:hypothetical protein